MRFTFDPGRFPNRMIIIDVDAGTQKMNCLGCGTMVEELFKNVELCWECYRTWSADFTEKWLELRFGTRAQDGRRVS